MIIFGYCIMPSHIHLIFRSAEGKPSELIRDFKGFTSRKLIEAIKENNQESRKEWLLWMLKKAGERNSNIKNYQLWQQNNKPIEIWSLKVFEQKLDYVHQNPVESGFVIEPWEWKYSSARNYCDDFEEILQIDVNRQSGHEQDARASEGSKDLSLVIKQAKIEKDIKTIFDFENLLTAWGFYQETDGYKDLEKNPVEGFSAFKDDMDKIKIIYNEK